MRTTTSSQFVMWAVYLEDLWKEHTKEDYYMAQIALELRRHKVKNPAAVKLKHMLISFTVKAKQTATSSLVSSKSYWMALVGNNEKK